MKKVFDFKRERNFDDIIDGGFRFFSQNGKKIIQLIWQYNRFLITGLAILYVFYVYFYLDLLDLLSEIQNNEINSNQGTNKLTSNIIFTLMLLFNMAFIPRFLLSIMGYIKLYMENEGVVVPGQLYKLIKRKFWSMLGLIILLTILYFVFFVFFSLTIYLVKNISVAILLVFLYLFVFVYLSLVFIIAISAYFFENLSISQTLYRSMSYLRGNFWKALGVSIVSLILFWLLSLVINIPALVYYFFKIFWILDESNTYSYVQETNVFISFISVFSFVGEWIIRLIFFIIAVILYFSLRESYTGEGVKDKIEQIGVNDNE